MKAIATNLDESEAIALAQLCKRIGFNDFRLNAVDDNEAYKMQNAMHKIRMALADQGYNPR